MKRILAALIATACTFSLYAQNQPQQQSQNTTSYKDFRFDLDVNYTRVYVKPQGHPTLDGNMGGMEGNFEYIPADFIYAAVGGSWRYGSIDGKDSKRHLLDGEVYERIGYNATFLNKRFLLTPFTGFGYRHLSHNFKRGVSLKMRYNEFYIPVGLLGRYNWDCASIGFFAIWMPQVYPTVTFDVTDGARWVTKATYKNFRVGLPILYHFQSVENLSIFLKPSFELWQDGKTTARTSSTRVALGIPQNTYIFWEVGLGLEYKF
ncbi:MAG: hypothetical protein H7A41_06590 [Chlamydiales bacterium]|nr:hypothetical protein [Chlamydiia bacterium]MCP5504803.1 hypothetical protein [Chlamydiales bacterium]